ncbi:unnamed protein product, partial [Mesorhabditis belari]|uniref:Uncharacterized protein n=1 Tax=Mesorhabditis belari TaxID=2138241 RepID=A0AAF3FLI5_9BILA
MFKAVFENWTQYNQHKGLKTNGKTPRQQLFDKILRELAEIGEEPEKTLEQIKKRIKDDIWRMKECAQKKAGQGIEPFELRQGTVKAGPLNLDSIIKRKGNGEEWNGTYRKTAVPYYLGEMEKLLWNEDQSLIEDQPATSSLLENSIDQGSGTSIEAILGSLKGDTREIPSDENTAWLDLKPPILTEAPELRNVEQFFRASSSVSFENSIQSEARNNIKSNHDEEKCEFEMKRLRKENEDLQEEYDGLKQRAYYQMGAHQDQILRLEAQVRELKKEIKRLNGFQQSKQL